MRCVTDGDRSDSTGRTARGRGVGKGGAGRWQINAVIAHGWKKTMVFRTACLWTCILSVGWMMRRVSILLIGGLTMADEHHVVSFSGGKDSTAMLLLMLDKGLPVDDIIFCDTGVEFPALYQHIDEVERYIGRNITRLKWEGGSYEWEFAHHVKLRGNNPPGRGWASFRNRWCTQYFKSIPTQKYLRGKYGKNYTLYIGIAYDEPKRHKNIPTNVVHLLYDWQITEAQALEYCYDNGFDFGGLYNIFPRLGCYCCPLQRKQSWRALYDNFPDLFDRALQMELDCEHDTRFANGKKLADYAAEFKAVDEMERISIPLFVEADDGRE